MFISLKSSPFSLLPKDQKRHEGATYQSFFYQLRASPLKSTPLTWEYIIFLKEKKNPPKYEFSCHEAMVACFFFFACIAWTIHLFLIDSKSKSQSKLLTKQKS